jgi:aerobic carbon-monoxide dehydrogenase medium subunit
VKSAAFEYHAPARAEEITELLGELGDGAKVIAGGQSLVPMMALRLAVFDHLVDIRNVSGLRGIEERNGNWKSGADEHSAAEHSAAEHSARHGWSVWIGAGTTQAAIGSSDLVAKAVPLLARATPLIGHFQIRNRGTIGGSLAHAEAAAEYPAVALALGATVAALSPRGQRSIPVAEFFTGIWSTALEADELLTGVTFPVWGSAGGGCGFAVEEFARRPGDFALAGAAVAVELSGLDGSGGSRIRRCGIGLIGLGPTPLRASAAEASVTGTAVGDAGSAARAKEIGATAMAELDSVPSDLHGPAKYRKRVGAAMVATAWQRAVKEAVNQEAASA